MHKNLTVVSLFSVALGLASTLANAKQESSDSSLHDKFAQISFDSLAMNNLKSESPSIFIEQELASTIDGVSSSNDLLADPNGQWSVSFDLNQLTLDQGQWNFNQDSSAFGKNEKFDWELGTSLVSPDKTSRFYVNYGNRKVPISISFDDAPLVFSPNDLSNSSAQGLTQDALKLGFEQSINESWAVSISYQKSDNNLSSIVNDEAAKSFHQLNYLFDFDNKNRIETVNFSPFEQNLSQSSFMDDISAIQIKVSRKLSDDLSLSAKASQHQATILSALSPTVEGKSQYKAQELALEGRYSLTDNWSLDANIEHQAENFSDSISLSAVETTSEFNQLDSTTLDIGVQYQSNWDQVGVVIRIDLMNLLGASNASEQSLGLDHNGLKPFSFDTPKYIKLTGSINF